MMQIGMVLGFIASFPANWYSSSRGRETWHVSPTSFLQSAEAQSPSQ
jgi:hypothetical protein